MSAGNCCVRETPGAPTASHRTGVKIHTFVKWGCRCFTSLKKIRNFILGRDDAWMEWKRTKRAAERGIRTLPFELVASPRWERGCLQTILVTRYLEKSQNVIEFLTRNAKNPALGRDADSVAGS